MSESHHVSLFFSSVLFTVLLFSQAGEVASLKAGKVNVTARSPGLFACEQVSFTDPFAGGQKVKVLASFGHALKRPTRGYGATLWLESIRNSGFRICVLEFGDGSNGTAEVNWIALQSMPSGAQMGATLLNSWTTGTECKKILFPQRFLTTPRILVTPSHQFPGRPQDATAVWVEQLREESVKICARETKMFDGLHQNIQIQWLAFTSLGIENFTLTDSLVFASNKTSPLQKNFAVCEKVNFTNPFFAPPVVVVTPKRNNSRQSGSTGCDAITAWVEYTSVRETEICLKSYDRQQDVIEVDYMVVGDLDPCLDVTCHYHGLCKAYGPRDARCVCINNCPSYQEPICSSNGKSYDNICLFKREMCGLQLNYTVQHPGSCEGFPFQRGRRHMPHVPSLGYSHCEVIQFRPYVFYPDKPIAVQITVNHIDTSDKSYVHDAAVSWVENVYYHQFTACVMAAGFNERKSTANVTVDWIAYQGAPVGGVAGEVRISQWWTGTTCENVNFPLGKFLVQPSVFVTAKHNNPGLKRDACSLWVEDVTQTSSKICMRELQNYAGAHKDIYVNWMAFTYLHKPPFSEHNSIYFMNNRPPDAQHNNAYCKDVAFASVYNVTPHVFVSANHSTAGGNLSPVHNGITAWVEYINKTDFRVCFKELYGTRYDPLSIAYTVLSEICPSGWGYFNGYCYFTSSMCTTWLTAVTNCSAMGSQLVTVHNQEENVYIQHRHNGEKSWIGLNDRSVEGSFVWTNKEISSFRFWAPRQPNNWRNEDCVHALGARHGYTWNDVPCDNCYNFTCFKVIDQCITNYHSCDVNAICKNTVGSYVCTCKAGYTGDGRRCFDIDECATNTHGCDVNAVCNNTVGSHNCTCKPGFSGNGSICTGVDKCATNAHDCDVNAVCNNTVGTYVCTCKRGYSGNGKTCTDIDECTSNTHDCDANAVCSNTVGSYDCTCSPGFGGNGKKCSVPLRTFTTNGRTGRSGVIQTFRVPKTTRYVIKAFGARGGTHSYSYGWRPGTYYGGRGASMEGTFTLNTGTVLNIVVGQRGGNSVEVRGGRLTNLTAAQLGLSVEDNAGTGGGGGSFVYTTSNALLLAVGGGGGASSGYNGSDGQSGTNGTSSVGYYSSYVRQGGVDGLPGECNSVGASYHGGVGAGWLDQGCSRAGTQHGERGGSRAQGWVGGRAGRMNSGYNGGPTPGAVGGFGGGGGGSEDNGSSGGGGGYSGGGSGTHHRQAGGGGGSYCSGTSCSGVTGGNSNDNGLVQIFELSA